jgi:5,10-methylenetetrahydromethanopterin reductase
MFRCSNPPELVREFTRRAEGLGYDELWVVEDCFYAAAISTATAALGAAERITVGIGVLPAVLRNPALAAMELAALARLHPDRLLAGFGHGVADWMRQVGAFPESQLAALGETVTAVRRLLAGERVSMEGRHVRLDGVALEHPPERIPPIFTGVRGPKSLRLSGEVADGTILTELSGPSYVRWARERIEEGRRNAGRTDDHRITVYALWGDSEEVRRQVAKAGSKNGPALGPGEQLAVTGRDSADALRESGADAVILVPSSDPAAAERELEQAAGKLLG